MYQFSMQIANGAISPRCAICGAETTNWRQHADFRCQGTLNAGSDFDDDIGHLMSVNSAAMSLHELHAKLESVNQQIKELKAAARKDVLQMMDEYGITSEDIFGKGWKSKTSSAASRKPHPLTGVKKAMKYRHPDTGASWAGTGLKPKWLQDEIAAGLSLDEFLIK